ncbi:MAG: endonuclease MutS2 [Ruminococcaceae bacterium]|nr:endonuclease MutS2 [Oscillospiraceae bacterium]
MLITEKTLKTLEFDRVRIMLADCAPTEGAKKAALMLTPSDDADNILRRQRHTTDARSLMDVKGMPPFGDVHDVSDICERAEKGSALTPKELLYVASLLKSSRMLLDYIRNNKTINTSLDDIFERLIPARPLEDRIGRTVISEDMIADEASPALGDIRRKMRAASSKIKETLQKYVGGAHSKYLQENIVTMRNGRYVVPVKAEHKNEIKGLLHDSSSSGATLFIEPIAVVDANNELRELESKEQHEIERILYEISGEVAKLSYSLILNYKNLTELSFIFACASLSERMGGIQPRLSGDRSMYLTKARHPLIPKERVVPIDVRLGGDFDTLVITGPNTGGKTVTLKTLGLFALMAQAGLHIPADEPSSICVFDNILADIGDEQSIEQSLSTFSSHMVNIVSIINDLTPNSLVLFDELGVGTDPIEGAALAVAVIEDVRECGALCASTTHYAELKAYALETVGVCNASCEFDVSTLRPTYKLIIGTPGKSNAFAISEKLGLPSRILDRAKAQVSSDNKRFEDVIEKLELSRMQMEKAREETEIMRADYEKFKAESEKVISRKLKEAETETEKAKEKAAAMVRSAKASSDFILEEMTKLKKQRDAENLGEHLDAARRNVREHLRKNESKFDPVEERSNEEYVLPRPLRKGDEVLIVSINKKGFILDDPEGKDQVGIQAGILKTRAKVSDLRLIESSVTITDAEKKQKAVRDYKLTVSRNFKSEVDLRGMMGDEAWFVVDKYLDEALIAGINSVRLIHGKGTGALRKALWNYLKGDKRVAAYKTAEYGEGDFGVTVVELK